MNFEELEKLSGDDPLSQFKRFLHITPGAKEQWIAFTDKKGNGVHEPEKHDQGFMQTFMDMFEMEQMMEENEKMMAVASAGYGPAGPNKMQIKTMMRMLMQENMQ